MINIMKSDLFRIFKGKAIYSVLIVIILLAVVSTMSMQGGHIGLSVGSNVDINDYELMEELNSVKSLTEFRNIMKRDGAYPIDKNILENNINLYYLFIVIVVSVLATDFSNKSIKNTLSSAITRKKYYFSKLLLILGISTILILFNNYFNYFLNLVINGKEFSSPITEITKITFMQLPLLYGIISLLVCIAFLFRKTSIFNTISIPFIMIVQLVGMGLINLFKLKAAWFYDYEIQFALSKLVNNPSNKYLISCIILGLVYIIVFNVIGYCSFKKAEIN